MQALVSGDIARYVAHEPTGRYDHIVQGHQRYSAHATHPITGRAPFIVIDIARIERFVPNGALDDAVNERCSFASSIDSNDRNNVVIVVLSASGHMHAFISRPGSGMKHWFERI